jgi:hypothetical protein
MNADASLSVETGKDQAGNDKELGDRRAGLDQINNGLMPSRASL